MPKLRMIWSGETVLVSKLVSDHTKTVRRRNSIHSSHPDKTDAQFDTFHNEVKPSESSESNVPHFNFDYSKYDHQKLEGTSVMDTGESTHSKMVQSSSPLKKSEISSQKFHVVDNNNSSSIRKIVGLHSRRNLSTNSISGDQRPTGDEISSLPYRSNTNASSIRRSMNDKDPNVSDTTGSKIYISNTAAPSRRLLLPLVEMQSTLQEMNQRIMAGLGVCENEWESLRQQSIDLGQMFNDQVHFQWERSSSFETTSKRNEQLVDIESNIRSKQTTLDTFNESDNEEEDDEAHSYHNSNDKVRIQRKRLEL